MTLWLDRIASPIGDILLVHDAAGFLRALDFFDYEARMRRLLRRHYGLVALTPRPAPASMRLALGRYFDGDLAALSAIPTRTGGTPFQRAVWATLATIPPGATLSYNALARRIGRPRAVRAVGAANGATPIALVVPCHRVIGADGALTGFGGGLARKAFLLRHEGALSPQGFGPIGIILTSVGGHATAQVAPPT